jgi:purine-cytosine permease-like protein
MIPRKTDGRKEGSEVAGPRVRFTCQRRPRLADLRACVARLHNLGVAFEIRVFGYFILLLETYFSPFSKVLLDEFWARQREDVRSVERYHTANSMTTKEHPVLSRLEEGNFSRAACAAGISHI